MEWDSWIFGSIWHLEAFRKHLGSSLEAVWNVGAEACRALHNSKASLLPTNCRGDYWWPALCGAPRWMEVTAPIMGWKWLENIGRGCQILYSIYKQFCVWLGTRIISGMTWMKQKHANTCSLLSFVCQKRVLNFPVFACFRWLVWIGHFHWNAVT